jgi:diadenosine tetraphosphate (Ap4A) HIT family hydrolase
LIKGHYRELTDLPVAIATAVFSELLAAHQSAQDFWRPQKMNLCSLGNVVDHLHWHLFPRYQDDPKLKNPPWLQMQEFDTKKISPNEAEKIILEWKKKFAFKG